MLQQVATIVYWIEFGIVVLASLMALLSAVRRGRAKAAKRDLIFGLAGLIAAFGIAAFEKGTPSGFAILAVAAVAGAGLGFFAAKARIPLALVTALCVIFASIMVVFGEELAQSAGFYAFAFGFGIATGQGVKYLMAKKAKPEDLSSREGQPTEAPQPSAEATA